MNINQAKYVLLGENLGELSLSSSTLIVIVILLGGLAILDLSFSSILVTKLGLASMALTWKMCKITWLLHVVSKWYNYFFCKKKFHYKTKNTSNWKLSIFSRSKRALFFIFSFPVFGSKWKALEGSLSE